MRVDRQTFIVVVLALAGLALGALVAWQSQRAAHTAPSDVEGLLWPNPKSLAAFELIDQNGAPFKLDRLQGHWSLMFFGFTHCPDVCPTTLGVLRDVAAMLAADGEPAPRIVFVSVDPERDTPARLKSYVEFFDKRFIGLTGAPDKVAAFTGQLGIVYMKAPLPGTGGYTVDHTAAVLLVDPRVRLVGIFSAPHNAADIARRYMQIRHVVERDS